MEWHTGSATFRSGKDLDHPLNPMKGFTGQPRSASWAEEDDDDDEHEHEHDDGAVGTHKTSPDTTDADATPCPPYDLIYILDAIYHFPPSVPYFLFSVLAALAPGGVVAYTDVLPPPLLSTYLRLGLQPTLGIPLRNLARRPGSIEEYERELERMGYVDIQIKDWSAHVWPGFGADLRKRGGVWAWAGRGVAYLESSGWKFIAVRAARPETTPTDATAVAS
jgi:hypothetical protein